MKDNKKSSQSLSQIRSQVQDDNTTETKESQLKDKILSALASGQKTRNELGKITNEKDRDIRRAIQELRMDGYPICSSASSSGYWMGNKEEVRATIADYYSRANKLIKMAQKQEKSLNECWIKDSPFKEVCNGCENRKRCLNDI